jgi:DNA-binding NarL/FixJ family response regulator
VFTQDQLQKGFVSLTPRERSVVRLAMDGLSNKEIGARLAMSPKTVESRLTEIYERFGITGGRVELSRRAGEEGWLEVEPPAPVGAMAGVSAAADGDRG